MRCWYVLYFNYSKYKGFISLCDGLISIPLQELYPKFVSLSRTATKKDIAGFKHLTNIFDVIIRTPSEHTLQSSVELELQREEEETVFTTARREAVAASTRILSHTKELGSCLDTGFVAYNYLGSTDYIFKIFQEIEQVDDLPTDFREIFAFIHKNFGPLIHQELFENPAKLSKLKTIYTITPRR